MEGAELNDPVMLPSYSFMQDLDVPLIPATTLAAKSQFQKKAASAYKVTRNNLTLIIYSVAVGIFAFLDLHPDLSVKSYEVIWVTGVVLLLLMRQAAPDGVLVTATLFLTIIGVLTEKEAWHAFSNQVVLSVAGLGVLAHAVGETGIIDLVFNFVLGKPKSVQSAMIRLFLPALVLNVCISNTCVMSCLLPVIDRWSVEIGFHKAYFLLPLSYILLISGVFAIFSTSTNLIAQGLLLQHGLPGFNNFDLAIPTIACSLVAIVYLIIATPIMLRRFQLPKDSQESRPVARRANMYDLRVQIVGRIFDSKTMLESGLLEKLATGIQDVRSCERYGAGMGMIGEDFTLKLDDILLICTSLDGIVHLFHTPGIMIVSLDLSEEYGTLDTQSRQLVEVVLDKDCPLIGHRIGDARKHRPEYRCPIVAYRQFNASQGFDQSPRNGENLDAGATGSLLQRKFGFLSEKPPAGASPEIRLAPGDHVVFNAPADFHSDWKDSSDFVVVRRVTKGKDEKKDSRSTLKAAMAGCILWIMIVLVATSTLPLLEAVFLALLCLGFTCVSLDSMIRAVKLRTVLTIVGAFGLGHAIGKENVAHVLAEMFLSLLEPFGHRGLLIAIFAVTVALGVIFHGTAVVVLMYPICSEAAFQKGLPIHQVMAVLCIAVSCQMLSPISYQTNLMAYSTCSYQFADFTRVGFGVVICIAAVGIPICELCFPG